MLNEATPTLEPVPGVDLAAYRAQLIERFANEYVRDTLARLATDASDRIPKWLVPVIVDRRAHSEKVPLSAAVVASWAAYSTRYVAGESLPFRDRQESAVREAVETQRSDPVGFLRNSDWFSGLADDEGFTADFIAAYRSLCSEENVTKVIHGLLATTAQP
jgi:mannitol 2-dehydrogenase